MKISIWWLVPVIAAAIIIIYVLQYKYIPKKDITIRKHKNYDVITAVLPNTIDMDITGPKYWKLYDALDNNIPCSICRNKAVPLGTFRHDIVNGINNKSIFPFDKTNWKLWVSKVNELDKKVAA